MLDTKDEKIVEDNQEVVADEIDTEAAESEVRAKDSLEAMKAEKDKIEHDPLLSGKHKRKLAEKADKEILHAEKKHVEAVEHETKRDARYEKRLEKKELKDAERDNRKAR